MKPIAFITGATSGIGEAAAKILADTHYLILTGRRKDRLEALSKQLEIKTDTYLLNFDVRDNHIIEDEIRDLPDKWKEIDVLINNAGNAHGLSTIQEGNLNDWEDMIDINVKGLLYVSRAIIPGMIERKTGTIINIGSIAGIEVYPKGNIYNASKFAVNAITQGMRMDLNPFGIRVCEIKPGLVNTEFSLVRFKGDEEKAKTVYEGFEPLLAQDIAETIRFVVSRPPHVTIADMVVLPTAQASATIINKKL